jgi:type 1 glutamine amidotransferase
LLRGIDPEPFVAGGSLYKVSPLAGGTSTLLLGKVEGHAAEPVAWTYRRKDGGKSFYTSLGHVDDFRGPVLRKLLVNAIAWATP